MDTSLVALDTGLTVWIGKLKKDLVPYFLNATDVETSVYETLVLFFSGLLDSLNKIDLGTPKLFDIVYDAKHWQNSHLE
jgi:hypothetical protein